MPESKPAATTKTNTTILGGIYLGGVLVLMGLLWLAYNMNWISYGVFDAIFSWRMLLVVVGGYLLAVRQWTSGITVGAVGILFLLLNIMDITLSFTKIVLPVVIILAGVIMIVSPLKKCDKKCDKNRNV